MARFSIGVMNVLKMLRIMPQTIVEQSSMFQFKATERLYNDSSTE